jgi:hypothetical protein
VHCITLVPEYLCSWHVRWWQLLQLHRGWLCWQLQADLLFWQVHRDLLCQRCKGTYCVV